MDNRIIGLYIVLSFVGIVILAIIIDKLRRHFHPPEMLPDWEILEDANGEFSIVRNNLQEDDYAHMIISMQLHMLSSNYRNKFSNIEQARNAIEACEKAVEKFSRSHTTVKRHKYP